MRKITHHLLKFIIEFSFLAYNSLHVIINILYDRVCILSF
jgi:hypothetical protein